MPPVPGGRSRLRGGLLAGRGPSPSSVRMCSGGCRRRSSAHHFDPKLDPRAQPAGAGAEEPRLKRPTLHVDTRARRGQRQGRCGRAEDGLDGLGAAGSAVQADGRRGRRLSRKPSELLVLIPHTDTGEALMEIAANDAGPGRVRARIRHGQRRLDPLVVLFGCDTAGNADDPAGYAGRFLPKERRSSSHARPCCSTSTPPRCRNLLAALSREPARRRPGGRRPPRFRRTAVRDGLLAALAITAYGDADWRV